MAEDERGLSMEKKGAWKTPTLSFDGALGDIVQQGNKPTQVAGEPGDPGHRPNSPNDVP